ncbi:cilia- and flagella-associated protein 184 [Mixophyes fleayi]|uniref:cilia- and flagella-associated protein 184 n=1 Tax=Mixophyes fleayi TaxID=3061075 RepID=UPI003F4DD7A1
MQSPAPSTGQTAATGFTAQEDRAGTQPAGDMSEGGKQPSTGQEDAGEAITGQEAAQEPSTGQEDAREPSAGQEDAREPGTSHEGDREPGTSHEGDREPGTSRKGDREPGTSREGDREPGTSREGDREPGTSREGDREPGTSHEGDREHGTSHEGDREPGKGVEGDKEQSAEEEEGRITINEDIYSSQPQIEDLMGSPSEPHPESAEQAVIPEEGELETSVETDQRGPYTAEYQETLPEEQEEDTQPHVDKEEEGEDNPQEEVEQSQENPRETSENDQVQEELIQLYHSLVLEREKVQQQNSQLQHKLYEYFRRKKGEEARPEIEKHISDQEQRYLKYLTTLEEMRKQYQENAAHHEEQIEELSGQCQAVVSQIDREWTAFQEQKKKVALFGGSRRGTGKHATTSFAQELEQLQFKEERKEKEVIQVRLENVKLKNQIHRYESTLRSREELAEGLHLIDFEQLKIENQTYNEKIEERNEELLKLRKKITNTVQVLTHLKEKLQFVQAENQEQKERLMEVEALLAYKRDILTKTKQARDSLRMDNLKLKQKCGLLGNKVLLRDYEDKVDSTEKLSQRLESLKRRHAELTLTSKGIIKKIDEAKFVLED